MTQGVWYPDAPFILLEIKQLATETTRHAVHEIPDPAHHTFCAALCLTLSTKPLVFFSTARRGHSIYS